MTSTMEMLPAAPSAPEGGSNKKVLVAGALAAAVALGGAGYFLLLSGGDSSDESLAPVARSPKARTATGVKAVAPKPAAAKPAVVPANSTAQLGRDPFKALWVPQQAKPASATTAQPPATSGSTAGSSSTSPKVGERYPLKMVTVKKQAGSDNLYLFSFEVDGVKKTVMQGQRFGKYGELVVLGYLMNTKGTVVGAILQVGDDSPLELVVGDKVLVQ